mgnify:CR=1 FL=1
MPSSVLFRAVQSTTVQAIPVLMPSPTLMYAEQFETVLPLPVLMPLAVLLNAEQFDDARQWCRLGLSHYAGDPRFTECELTLLGWTGSSPEDVSTAWRHVSRIELGDSLNRLAPTWGYRRLMAAAVIARQGMSDSARQVLRTVQTRMPAGSSVNDTALPEAYVRLLLNDREGALSLLARSLKSTPQARAQLAQLPWFGALHGDPRFDQLVRPTR